MDYGMSYVLKMVVVQSVESLGLGQGELTLAKVGHRQQLRHRFNIWSILSLSLCLVATWEALSTTIVAALISGGPVSVIYGFYGLGLEHSLNRLPWRRSVPFIQLSVKLKSVLTLPRWEFPPW
jgi:hypothetical protein